MGKFVERIMGRWEWKTSTKPYSRRSLVLYYIF